MDDASHRPAFHDQTFKRIMEGTAGETGQAFFDALVKSVAQTLGVRGAWITEYLPNERRLRSLSFWMGDDWVEEYAYDLAGTPCELVIDESRLVHVAERVVELFPNDPDLPEMEAVSYLGVPLRSGDGRVVGHLAALDTAPLEEDPQITAIFQIFANRAAAEMRRIQAESEALAREEKLTRLIDSAMDAILELDVDFNVTRANPAAVKVFGAEGSLDGMSVKDLLASGNDSKVEVIGRELLTEVRGRRYRWIPGGVQAKRVSGEEFPAEATLSSFEMSGEVFFTLILRDVNDRRAAERTIRGLRSEADYLREEVDELKNFGEILGDSPALRTALEAVHDVANTDTTVLLLGETGTGKELFARALHAASTRREHALIRVNCSAVPGSLIESEFFGHEKGAFTGAVKKREGRFHLADGGTIFLDEIGELPPDLQAKLLRVLQEGEFEPVGSSATVKVDVRVIAATHRNLEQGVADGSFREDLYYRLNVFPLRIPPLRERGTDVILLARAFRDRIAAQLGKPRPTLTADDEACLQSYTWPGNVRELQNVMERAIITCRDGSLQLSRLLAPTAPPHTSGDVPPSPAHVLTARELKNLERENLVRALDLASGKVAGPGGAAEILGLPPSTVSSRMRTLGVRRTQ